MPDPTQIAHYKITGKLGEGGMGAVYRATDTKLNREVAIKVIPDAVAQDPDRLIRFTREAQLLAALNHPNIATIYGVEARAIVMELIEGQPIAGPLNGEEALPIVNQLIDALEYAHDKGIVHRDLKPANILLTTGGRVKVLDFGLAKALANDPGPAANSANSPTLTMAGTQTGLIMGTAAYMSPEQARGNPVDKRSDIWSFGVVVFELLTGKQLFGQHENVSDILADVLRQGIDLTPVPARFRKLLQYCLTRDPNKRLRDISGARLLLEEVAPVPVFAPASCAKYWPLLAGLAIAAVSLGVAWYATRPVDKPLTRFNVDLGPEAFADSRNFFALSPDGRRLVYTSRTPEGKQLLATRLLDQAKVAVLQGTEDATDPFFSPNGDWVGFIAGNQLRKIAVTGGGLAAITTTSPNMRGAAWLPDGSILFAMNPASGLSRLPANGGPIQTVTTPSTKGESTHRWPQLLPDGHTVLFTAHRRSTGFDEAEIAALDLRTGQWKTVQKGGYFGRYLPSGHLVYVRLGNLYAVRFDAAAAAVQGLPVSVLDDLAVNRAAAAGRFHFAPQGDAFAYVAGNPETVTSRPVWLDKSGTTEPFKFAGSPSPDGKLIAFHIGALTKEDIKVWDPVRDVVTSITSNGRNNRSPVWAPDGKHLLYSSRAEGDWTIWWARADGGAEPQKLFTSQTRSGAISITPDGRLIAFGNLGISTIPLDLTDPENPIAGKLEDFSLTAWAELLPVFSPDGRWIAYVSQESGEWVVNVRPFPGPGGRWQIGPGGFSGPRWSRTGRQLFYATQDGRVMVCDYETKGDTFIPGKPRLWTETRIGDNLGAQPFELSPDGQRILTYVNPVDTATQPANVHITFLLNFFDELKRRLPN